ncbi:MAG: beta-ketoacyl synthase, partial [Thermoanaerobaculia bacterium]|nr:beta-ketoacyl synthase [Thermoanaerobaculia bacterium]
MKAPVITGESAVTALGRTLEETRAALAAGRSAIGPVEEDGAPKPGDRSEAARIGPFTTEPELAKGKARRLDRGSQYAVVAVRQVLTDAGYALAGREERTGILLGTGSAGVGPLTEFERQMAVESPDAASPFLFPNTVANAPASQAAIEVGLKGPNVTITQKDPSALNALLYSALALSSGRAKAMLAGAVDEWNFFYAMGFDRV